jgi:hypothetical protein
MLIAAERRDAELVEVHEPWWGRTDYKGSEALFLSQ